MPSFIISAGEADDTCQKCNKASEDVVVLSVNNGDNLFLLCKDCIANAVTAAVDEGEETSLVE